jgi:xanthine/uracil permease
VSLDNLPFLVSLLVGFLLLVWIVVKPFFSSLQMAWLTLPTFKWFATFLADFHKSLYPD